MFLYHKYCIENKFYPAVENYASAELRYLISRKEYLVLSTISVSSVSSIWQIIFLIPIIHKNKYKHTWEFWLFKLWNKYHMFDLYRSAFTCGAGLLSFFSLYSFIDFCLKIGVSFMRNNCHKSRYKTVKAVLGTSQTAFTCSKLTIETLEQGVKYVQS